MRYAPTRGSLISSPEQHDYVAECGSSCCSQVKHVIPHIGNRYSYLHGNRTESSPNKPHLSSRPRAIGEIVWHTNSTASTTIATLIATLPRGSCFSSMMTTKLSACWECSLAFLAFSRFSPAVQIPTLHGFYIFVQTQSSEIRRPFWRHTTAGPNRVQSEH